MGRQTVTDQQAGFAGGLNSVSDPAFLRPDQARQTANFRLSNFGAALKRLGTQFTTSAAISTFDTTNSVYGGIYWPTQDKVYVIGGSSASSAMSIYEGAYALPTTFSTIGTVMQYRPVIFTDGTYPEVMYLAGDNTQPVQKVYPTIATITLDHTSSAQSNAGAGTSSLTWSHVVGAGSNRILVVMTAGGYTSSATSVVWDPGGTPQSLTKLSSYTVATQTVSIWYLLAPPVATKNITATWASNTQDIGAAAASFLNVSQSHPITSENTNTASGTDDAPTLNVASTAHQVVVDVAFSSLEQVLTVVDQSVIRSGGAAIGAGYKAADNGFTTVSFTGTSLGTWSMIGTVLNPAVGSPDVAVGTIPPTTPAVKGLVVYNDRLWGWNGAYTPNSLYFSDLSASEGSLGGDSLGDTSAGGGQIIVRTFGISEIVACAPVGGSLLIFHERGISRLTGFGQDDISVAPQALTADVGMSNATPSGICVYANVAYFATDRGIYSATESSVAPLGTPDKPDPTSVLLSNGTVNPSQFELDYNRQYNEVWVSIKDYGVYIYNAILGSWSGPFTGTYADGTRAIFEVVNSTNGNSHLWRITWRNATGMFVSECDRSGIYKDDVTSAGAGGSVVTGTLQPHRFFGGDRVFAKSWRWFNLLAQLTSGATPPVVSFMTQLGGTSTQTMSGLSSLEQPYYLSPGGTGPYLDLTITDTGSAGTSQYTLATVQGNMLGQR